MGEEVEGRNMFTGIIECRGEVLSVEDRPGGRRMALRPLGGDPAAWAGAAVGESISVSGVCLTVVKVEAEGQRLEFEVVPETLSRSTLGALRRGSRVNLERSLRVGDRLGGHWVAGHVEGVGKVARRTQEGDQVLFRIAAPPPVLEVLLPKGSVAVDGVSLTVVQVDRREGWFSFAAIPHTLAVTTLGEREAGDAVNLEGDPLGRWVLHAVREVLGRGPPAPPAP